MGYEQDPVDVPMPASRGSEVLAVVFGIVEGGQGRDVARFYGYAYSDVEVETLTGRAERDAVDPQAVAVFWFGGRRRRASGITNTISGNTTGAVIQADRIDGGVVFP